MDHLIPPILFMTLRNSSRHIINTNAWIKYKQRNDIEVKRQIEIQTKYLQITSIRLCRELPLQILLNVFKLKQLTGSYNVITVLFFC